VAGKATFFIDHALAKEEKGEIQITFFDFTKFFDFF